MQSPIEQVTTKKNGIQTPVGYIEQHYPQTAKEFKRLQDEQYKLFCKKQMDYGPSNIAMGTSLDTDEEKRLNTTLFITEGDSASGSPRK